MPASEEVAGENTVTVSAAVRRGRPRARTMVRLYSTVPYYRYRRMLFFLYRYFTMLSVLNPAMGRAVGPLSVAELSIAAAIMMERHRSQQLDRELPQAGFPVVPVV